MPLYIGLMSGTSMDGIDAALLELPSNRLIHGITKKYSTHVKDQLIKITENQSAEFASICQLNTLIGREFAEAVNQLLHEHAVSAQAVTAIGSHGQTICHDAEAVVPYTWQLGCAHTISSLTGITVVADFRTRDMVNGGQGAPFAPIYHSELFKNTLEPIALVNIGGISNVSFIDTDHSVKGWDIGPGNCLMDAWINRHQHKEFDENGEWASKGTLIEPLLNKLMEDQFFRLKPPKSLGREYYSLRWLDTYLEPGYSAVDVQATLCFLTAQAIANAINAETIKPSTVYLCGGGTHNSYLHSILNQLITQTTVKSIEDKGVSPDYLEAMMFAWLAAQTMNQKPIDSSKVTGAKKPGILGAVYPMLS